MFDLIRGAISHSWTSFNWKLYEFLTNPRAFSLLLLVMMGLIVIGSYPVWRKCMLRTLLVTLTIYWLTITPLAAAAASELLMTFVPPDTGETADAIVVIGRGSQEVGDRYPIAVQLLAQGRAPLVFATGASGIREVALIIERSGLSLEKMSGSLCGRTTQEEAFATSVILGPQNVQKIILVSDRPHMLRAYLTFRARGFSVIPHPVDLAQKLPSARYAVLTMREYLGLISYTLLGRFNRGSVEALKQPDAESIQEIENRQCKVTPGFIAIFSQLRTLSV